MAVLEAEVSPKLLTYEDYLAEGVVYGRYDIIDGVRCLHAKPNAAASGDCRLNIYKSFRAYQRRDQMWPGPLWRRVMC